MSKKELKEKIKELEKKIKKLEKEIEAAADSPEWQVLPLFGNNNDNEVEVKISLKKEGLKKMIIDLLSLEICLKKLHRLFATY